MRWQEELGGYKPTKAELASYDRQLKKASGMVELRVWVSKEEKTKVLALINRMRR